MRIKIFESIDASDLEKKVNEWYEKSGITEDDIRSCYFQPIGRSNSMVRYTYFIEYEKPEVYSLI